MCKIGRAPRYITMCERHSALRVEKEGKRKTRRAKSSNLENGGNDSQKLLEEEKRKSEGVIRAGERTDPPPLRHTPCVFLFGGWKCIKMRANTDKRNISVNVKCE